MLEVIQGYGYVFFFGCYIGFEEIEDDDEVFKEKLDEFVGEFKGLFGCSDGLCVEVKKGLKELGYEF